MVITVTTKAPPYQVVELPSKLRFGYDLSGTVKYVDRRDFLFTGFL